MFFIYNLTDYRNRSQTFGSVPVDNSSLANLTALVRRTNVALLLITVDALFQIENSILRAGATLLEFLVFRAEVTTTSGELNVTVLVQFNPQCSIECQLIQLNRLQSTRSIALSPIVIVYQGRAHVHNISLIGKFSRYAHASL